MLNALDLVKWAFIVVVIVALIAAIALTVGTVSGLGKRATDELLRSQRVDWRGQGTQESLVGTLFWYLFGDDPTDSYQYVWVAVVKMVGLFIGLYLLFWVFRIIRTVLS